MKNCYILGIFCLSLFLSTLNAQTHQWTGNGGDSNWFNTANWDAGTIPDAVSTVLIPNGFTVEISVMDAQANTITLQGVSTLSLENNLTLGGQFSIPAGSNLNWLQGVISGTGSIVNDGLIQLESFVDKELIGFTLHNNGAIYITNSNIIRMSNGTVINNNSTGTIDILSNGGLIQDDLGNTVNNDGVIRKLSDGSGNPGNFYMIFDTNNNGVIEVNENQIFLFLVGSANLNNTETGVLKGLGVFDITANFTNTGTFAPGDNLGVGTLSVTNNFSLSAAAKLEFDIAGNTAGEYDVIQVTGFPNIEGNIIVNLAYAPAIGDEFTVITASDFTSCNLPQQITANFEGFEYTFEIFCNDNDVTLRTSTIAVLGQNEFDLDEFQFYVYPNPVSNKATFVFSSEGFSSEETTLSIYNYMGQRVLTVDGFTSETNTFQRGNLPAGLYFASVAAKGQVIATTRFLMD